MGHGHGCARPCPGFCFFVIVVVSISLFHYSYIVLVLSSLLVPSRTRTRTTLALAHQTHTDIAIDCCQSLPTPLTLERGGSALAHTLILLPTSHGPACENGRYYAHTRGAQH